MKFDVNVFISYGMGFGCGGLGCGQKQEGLGVWGLVFFQGELGIFVKFKFFKVGYIYRYVKLCELVE